MAKPDDRLVTVCDHCLCASCWNGIFMCSKSQTAGTTRLPISRLRELGREHPDHWRVL